MILQHAPAGRRAVDVSELPDQGAFGHRGLIWWGTVGFMVIEGSMFVMALITYFYLRLRVDEWPPSLPDPELFYGTLNLSVLLVSALPNHLAKVAAEALDLARTRRWLVICVLFGVVLLVIRGYEFTALNCRWDDNAYGSMVWIILGLHTAHLLTDWADTLVLTALMFTRHAHNGKRFSDVSDNCFYWHFVVASWVPLYLLLYGTPRL
jgi:cytochrome c oxidase subunit III